MPCYPSIWTLAFDDIQGNAEGLVANQISSESTSLITAPYPSRERGMGYRTGGDVNWSGAALVRGGYWVDGDGAGVFSLSYAHPVYAGGLVGFRCTKPE